MKTLLTYKVFTCILYILYISPTVAVDTADYDYIEYSNFNWGWEPDKPDWVRNPKAWYVVSIDSVASVTMLLTGDDTTMMCHYKVDTARARVLDWYYDNFDKIRAAFEVEIFNLDTAMYYFGKKPASAPDTTGPTMMDLLDSFAVWNSRPDTCEHEWPTMPLEFWDEVNDLDQWHNTVRIIFEYRCPKCGQWVGRTP